jgi:hypothetical protein
MTVVAVVEVDEVVVVVLVDVVVVVDELAVTEYLGLATQTRCEPLPSNLLLRRFGAKRVAYIAYLILNSH